MKTKLIAIALGAGLLLPATAQAHVSRGELRRDVQQVREEKRDVREERRERDWRGVREERRELGKAKRELKRDTYRFHRQHKHRR